MELFLIGEGVRRAVAVREFGGRVRPATLLDSEGKLGPIFFVKLEQLYSRKDRILRIDNGNRYLRMERLVTTAVGRKNLPAIEVTNLTGAASKAFTPLFDVVLEP